MTTSKITFHVVIVFASWLSLLAATAVHASPAERLAEAVTFQTISSQDPEQTDYAPFQAFNAFLRTSYPRVFTQLQVETINDYSLLFTWPGTEAQAGSILFTAHTDVVPVEPGTEDDWTHPAFAGVIADGMIYGRGTLDDKVGVLSLLEAVDTLLAEGYQPRKTIVLAFGHDEEVSGLHGAAALAARLREQGRYFDWMVDEGGLVVSDNPVLPEKPLAMINVAEKGYLTLALTVAGEGGHSSQPPAQSTIGRLSRALARLEQQPFPPRLVAPVDLMLETLAPHVEQPRRFAFANLWLFEGLVASQMAEDRQTAGMVQTTTALTMFNAGVKENVVPQRAEAKVNFRLLPGTTVDSVVAYVRDVIDDPGISIDYLPWENRPGVADHRAEGFGVIANAVSAVYPDAVVVPSLLVATTDTRHYVDLADNQYRFHGMQVPAAHTSGIHGTDEKISVASFENTILIAQKMLREGAR
ncbi:M20/M25/M40 family metallo-hydrolase [Pseudohalioglobus sediminis]|uniref:M20/M25/M40 family metallo-hydrolase n=1 Tax=Pseudohalioglobus sediminis TaxID=2606449 RepID=A0A5B0WRQ6_9GAMM|nr:M20/M25/M40 family metallo-hydrolase [Pseudohalioglobus sediminis]KAA1189015.1 M20/M25/M40 family metallo-hydrolase [Pseudohalioglobus sediminis]